MSSKRRGKRNLTSSEKISKKSLFQNSIVLPSPLSTNNIKFKSLDSVINNFLEKFVQVFFSKFGNQIADDLLKILKDKDEKFQNMYIDLHEQLTEFDVLLSEDMSTY